MVFVNANQSRSVNMLMYDPPSGWMYGFPKPYLPKENEKLIDTLRRDGYPEKELSRISRPDGTLFGVRFIGTKEELSRAP